ncbi:hypothetical protein DBR18_15525 [Pseudomonas sp. HMWF021]|nr:hypothetical protein DBR18_15525 [Pseudomonas sp. HMWF021]
MVSILADSVVAAQWGMGQKGIEMANLNDHRNAEAEKRSSVVRGFIPDGSRSGPLFLKEDRTR